MTTTVDPGNQADPSELWRAIGRLEGLTAAVLEGQRQMRSDMDAGLGQMRSDVDAGLGQMRSDMDAGFQQMRSDMDAGLREVNRRVDRLYYAILAIGGALVVAVIASRFIGG